MTEKEFRAYFRELYPQLGRYATRLLGDADVDDVLQVAFLELWNRRTDINTAAHVRAFMFRSVYTQALNVLKHRGVVRKYSTAATEMENQRTALLSPDACDVAFNMACKELRHKLETAMKNKEIAQAMNISVRTVDAHIYNALKQLRAKLQLADINSD